MTHLRALPLLAAMILSIAAVHCGGDSETGPGDCAPDGSCAVGQCCLLPEVGAQDPCCAGCDASCGGAVCCDFFCHATDSQVPGSPGTCQHI